MVPTHVRGAALLLAGALLLGALAFLFIRTAAVDARADAEAASILRELQAYDARMDQFARELLAGSAAPPPLPSRAIVEGTLRTLESTRSNAIAAEAPPLRKNFEAKLAAVAALQSAHRDGMVKEAAADEALAALALRGDAARLAMPSAATRAAALTGEARVLRAQLASSLEDRAGSLEARLATLREAGASLDAGAAEAARQAETAVRSLLQAREAQARALESVLRHPSGARLGLLSHTLVRSIEQSLQEQQRWRAYLFFYAAALLVAVAYLASRVMASRAALKAANESLERRVEERTRELSQALTRLKESEAHLVQSEKMSSLGQMVAGVAHEINTPLAYVKSSVETTRERVVQMREAIEASQRLMELLSDPGADPARLDEAFAALSACLARVADSRVMEDLESASRDGLHGIGQIGELVVNLRNFSRLDRSRIESFDVNAGIRSTLLIARTVLKDVPVDLHLGDVPPVTGSPSQVNQVLLNLVTNAAQAMDKPDRRITIRTRTVEGCVEIEVADNGKGIPPDVLPRIFDPFFTTKPVGEGTGLGLSIAYKIVQEHGGRLEARSEPGQGTTFTLRLPATAPVELHA